MLSKKHLVILYCHLICVGIVIVSYWGYVNVMETVIAAMTANETASGTGTPVYTSII
jgi:hypothetical protein